MSTHDDPFRQRMQRIEVLVQEMEALADPAARSGAVELVQAILELHGAGLERILLAIQEAGDPGGAIVEQLLRDDLVGSLLLLHDLHPLDPETRVRQALETLRPHLGVQGGRAELLGLDGGIARLHIDVDGHGSPPALKEMVRQAIMATAPEVTDVLFDGTGNVWTGAFIPLSAMMGVGPASPPDSSPKAQDGQHFGDAHGLPPAAIVSGAVEHPGGSDG